MHVNLQTTSIWEDNAHTALQNKGLSKGDISETLFEVDDLSYDQHMPCRRD